MVTSEKFGGKSDIVSNFEPCKLEFIQLGNHDADDVPIAIIDWATTASRLDRRIHLELA